MGANSPLWKRKIDDQLAAKKAREWADEEAKYAKRLADHQAKFKCHIPGCTVVSSGYSISEDFPDWDTPQGLWKCTICDQWTCGDHRHDTGVCMVCAGGRENSTVENIVEKTKALVDTWRWTLLAGLVCGVLLAISCTCIACAGLFGNMATGP